MEEATKRGIENEREFDVMSEKKKYDILKEEADRRVSKMKEEEKEEWARK